MDLFSIIGACFRRWYVTLPLVLLTAWAAYVAYESVEAEYTTSRWIVVLPSLEQNNLAPTQTQNPETGEDVDPPSNPYAGQGGSRFAVAVLTRNLNSTAFEARIEPRLDGRGTFEARAANEQPLIEITAVSMQEEDLYLILDAVVDEAAIVLNEVQTNASAPEETHYRIAPAVPPGIPEDATPSRFRVAGAVAVVGLGLAAVLAVAVDGLLRRRQQRLQQPQDGNPQLDESSSPTPEASPTLSSSHDDSTSEQLEPSPQRSP